jgi:hypothetical protein
MTNFPTLITLSLALNSCGTSPGSSSNAPEGSGNISSQEGNNTYYLASRADLKPCDNVTKNFLVYLKDEAVFLSCDGSTWSEVEIKTKETVTKVETKTVVDTKNVDDPAVFTDTITGKTWRQLGTQMNHPYELKGNDYVSACDSLGMKMPDRDDYPVAVGHGLKLHLNFVGGVFLTRIGDTGAGDQKFQIDAQPAIGYGYMPFTSGGATSVIYGVTATILCISK